jgi:hypothetical protein
VVFPKPENDFRLRKIAITARTIGPACLAFFGQFNNGTIFVSRIVRIIRNENRNEKGVFMSKKRWSKMSASTEIGRWVKSIRMPRFKIRTADAGGDETYQRQLQELLDLIEKARMLHQ